MNHSMRLVSYVNLLLLTLVLMAPSRFYGFSAKEKAILDASLDVLAHGHDLSLINAWHATAKTTRDGETSNTNFNSSCGSLVYGYRESEKSVVQSNTTFAPEFAPHIVAVVLFGEAHDANSAVSWKGTVAENGRVYDVLSIRPSYRGNRDAGYAAEQIWYFDQRTKLPKRIKFTGKDTQDILVLDDFRPSGEGWLAPYAAQFTSGGQGHANYQYTDVLLKHEQCP